MSNYNSGYSPFTKTKTIAAEWWDGHTVTIRQITHEDRLHVMQMWAKSAEGYNMFDMLRNSDMLLAQAIEEYMVMAIIEWSFVYANGNPVPVNRTTILEMPIRDFNFIAERIMNVENWEE